MGPGTKKFLWYDRSMKKFLTGLVVAMVATFGVVVATPATDVQAAAIKESGGCGNASAFFSLKPWYEGLTTTINGKCEIGTPDELNLFIWTAVLNILYDIMVLVGYIATVMIAWGGFLYMFSRGEPARAEKGKKTLIAAVAGLAISMLASVIMNTIVAVLSGGTPN